MSSMVCRLCLNDSKLIDLFDNRLTNSAQLKECILLGTGVDICRTDKVSTYICHLCSDIAIFLYKYRKNAVANDKALKEFANQHFKEPPTHTKDVVPLNNKILSSLNKDVSRTEVPEQNDTTVKTFENRKKPPQTNIAVHPTIIQLIKKNPRLKIPNDLLKYDIQPKIALNKNEVEQYKPPPPKRSVTPENKPVSAMERFKMKFPGINIMKISNNSNIENNVGNIDENKDGTNKETIIRSISNEVNIGSTENARKRKASTSEDLIPMMKQRFNGVDENIVKVSKTIENKCKSFDSQESKVHVSEEKVKITEKKLKTELKVKFNSDIQMKTTVINKTKGLTVVKHKKKRTSDNENGKLERTLPKLKISLRKSTESTNETPTVSIVDSVMDTITAVIQTVTSPTPPTTSMAPPPAIVNVVDNKMDTSEIDTEKITPKKLNKKKKIFDSDSEDSDSIGANDLVIDDTFYDDLPADDLSVDVPLVDDRLTEDRLTDDNRHKDELPRARIPKERVFEDKVDESVLDALLDTFEEEMALHCVHCNKMFASPFQLKCHERTHKNCTVCKAVFRSNEALRHHHTEVCFKVVISNPPDVQLTRIDEDPELMRRYHYAFDSPDETNEANKTNEANEIDSDVLYISDDDNDVVFVEDSGDRSNGGLDVSQNREYQHIKNVFSKYQDLKIQLATKSRNTEMKPQMHVRFNSKGQIVLENMFPELKYYRVPVELIAKSTSFAYISYNERQSEAKELYDWSNEPVISLRDKSVLSTAKRKMTGSSIKKKGNKLLNATNQTQLPSLKSFRTIAPNQQTMATPSMNLSETSINISAPPVNINIQNSATPVNINAPILNSVLNTPSMNTNMPVLTPISDISTFNSTPVITTTSKIITTPTNPPNLTAIMVNTSNLITTPVNRDMPDLTPVNVTTSNSTIPIVSNLKPTSSGNMFTPSILTTPITDKSNLASTSAMNNISNLTPPPVNRNMLNVTVNRNNFTSVNTSNLFAMPVSMSNLAPSTNQSVINRSLSEEVIDLLDDAVPSTSGTNDAYAQQQRAGKENLSLRVKTPWELNNING